MHFLVNDELQFLMGWSAKCACSSIKTWFVQASNIEVDNTRIHEELGYGRTKWSRIRIGGKEKYSRYKKFILIRNPFARLVSGYVNKYVIEQAYQSRGWRNFAEFLDVLHDDKRFRKIEKHHFTPQTSEQFKKAVRYEWRWDHVLNTDTLEEDVRVLNGMLGTKGEIIHRNKTPYRESVPTDKPGYLMSNDEILAYMPPRNSYFNKEIVEQVRNYYDSDFRYFSSLGFSFNDPHTD